MGQNSNVKARPLAAHRFHPLLAASLVLALGACSATPSAPLEDVCQFRACACVDSKAAFWQFGDRKPLLWAENGAPYCPPGYTLRLTGEE